MELEVLDAVRVDLPTVTVRKEPQVIVALGARVCER